MSSTKIIVCSNEEKMNILKKNSLSSTLQDIKFMTKEEYMKNYYFDYSYDTIYYLMKKYQFDIDVAKVYLDNMMVIELDKDYKSSKLNLLKELKKELIENKLLYFHPSFSYYISNKEIEVKHYYNLDLYEEKALNTKITIPDVELKCKVYSFSTMEDEISYICKEIIKLLKKGISIHNIYLGNVSTNYYYTIEKIFSYYHIPINIPYQKSIYSTKVIQDYLDTKEIDLEDDKKNSIYKKLIKAKEKLINIEEDEIYDILLKDVLEHTYLSCDKKKNAVSIVDIEKQSFTDNDYVFVVGFNQDDLPKNMKDINYISDSIIDEVDMYSTTIKNEREKKATIYLLSKIKNLFLSFKLSTPFMSFYPSSLISELNLEVVNPTDNDYNYSNLYNKILLTEKLDQYYLYGEKDNSLELLYSNYEIPYRTYSNRFTGINKDTYLNNLAYPLKLSYSSLNMYNECKFKYYIKNVLKLDEYTPTFAAFIGSMYHEILSLWERDNFDLDREYQKYLETRDLSLKETLLLVRIKKDLTELLDILSKQKLLLGYNEILCEKKIEIDIKDDISVKFIGFIDKILFYQKIDDTYFSIIDYKTGNIDTNIEPMKYGLHMQLPIYLYLIYYSKVFSNPIFTGIYYQNILFSYPTWSEKLEKEKKDKYLLKGYSTNQVELLSRFDSTYYDSEVIKSLKYSEDKGFGTYSKVLDDDTVLRLIQYTKNHIKSKTEEILKGDFTINPKVYKTDNVSCKYCSFKDLCYMKENDLVYLETVKDLSFLGGEE